MSARVNHFLLGYALVVSTVAAGAFLVQAVGAQSKVTFDEIDVKRINLREEDGTLRLAISNTQRFPGVIVKGKEQPHLANRRTAGMVFFNEEGSESGGLLFSGKKVNGKVVSDSGLTFDRYEQDQVIALHQGEDGNERYAALQVIDRPDQPMDFAGMAQVAAMLEGPAKEAAMKKLMEGGTLIGKQRVQIGRSRDRSSALVLHDAEGRPRMWLEVTAEGAAAIKFLDENMKVVRTVTAAGVSELQKP
jgi:hypothetical protein